MKVLVRRDEEHPEGPRGRFTRRGALFPAAVPGANRRAPATRWAAAFITVIASFAAAWPLATLIMGSPFAKPMPKLTLKPAEEAQGAYFRVPEFRHIDQDGASFGSEQLEGKVWVASFFFSSCRTMCPKLMASMRSVQDRLGKASPIQLVSFTVDPTTDSPEVLRAYGEGLKADFRNWTFVTDEPEAIEATIVRGFKQPMGEPDRASASEVALSIAHGQRLVLVDRTFEVRGLYDTDQAGLEQLVRDAGVL